MASLNSALIEQEFARTGLHSFHRGLIGTKVLVELRAGTIAIGTVMDCDTSSNVHMRDALILRAKKEEAVDEFFIAGRHIRYIHMFNYNDMCKAIRKSCAEVKTKKKKRTVR
ncbi:unnamed protein product [Nippostrongylus brasiliensis]|uniref:Sm domain-containing protein n=1 Tax=Nippostrongylus brasiliensis TaxID=27835 RepID=A0A0N4Y6Q4_NIPBR|nr:unnamed protein product [Nippostrongylus brasiliensis]